MRPGGVDGRRSVATQVPQAVTAVLPVVPKEPASGTGRPPHQKPVGHTASTAVVVESGLYLGPHGAGCHMTCPAPRVGSCLHHLGHRIRKCQRGLGPRVRPSTDVMEVTQSPPLSWEDQVREEEDEQERHSSIGGDSQPCPSPARMEGCSVSDISMAEEGPSARRLRCCCGGGSRGKHGDG